MNKVRIAVDTSKASPYLIEIFDNNVWVERYRFTKRKKAQEVLTQFFGNREQVEDFKYENQA